MGSIAFLSRYSVWTGLVDFVLHASVLSNKCGALPVLQNDEMVEVTPTSVRIAKNPKMDPKTMAKQRHQG